MVKLIHKEKSRRCYILAKRFVVTVQRFQDIVIFDLNYAFSRTFAKDFYGVVGQVHRVRSERANLGNPCSGCEQNLQYGDISNRVFSGKIRVALPKILVSVCKNFADYVHRDNLRQYHRLTKRRVDFVERIRFDEFLRHQIMRECFQRSNFALSGFGLELFVQVSDVVDYDIFVERSLGKFSKLS